jgi:hypothetical protein
MAPFWMLFVFVSIAVWFHTSALPDAVSLSSRPVLRSLTQFTGTGVVRFAEGGSPQSQDAARASLALAVFLLVHAELALIESEEWFKKLSAAIGRGNAVGLFANCMYDSHRNAAHLCALARVAR